METNKINFIIICPKRVKNHFYKLWNIFTKLLTPGLIHELCISLDDWLESTSSTHHSASYIIYRLTWKLKKVGE